MSVTIEADKLNYFVFKLERMLWSMFVAGPTDLTAPYTSTLHLLLNTATSEVCE
jgi:hypothetical protein